MMGRLNSRGVVPAVWAVLVVAVAAAASWFILFDGEDFKVEARIYDVDYSNEPINGKIDVRVTNHLSQDLVVEHLAIAIWANAERTVQIYGQSVDGVGIPAGQSNTGTYRFELTNSTALGGAVWVDLDARWNQGGEPREVHVEGHEVSIGAALEQLT
jgi:hypothetical protein